MFAHYRVLKWPFNQRKQSASRKQVMKELNEALKTKEQELGSSNRAIEAANLENARFKQQIEQLEKELSEAASGKLQAGFELGGLKTHFEPF